MRPHLRAFLKHYSKCTLQDYYKRLLTTGSTPSALLVEGIISDLKHTYGEAEFHGKDLTGMLLRPRNFFVANHGGIENHPQLIAASILTELAAATLNEDNFIFACNLITPKNPTAPLGFYLASEDDLPLGQDYSVDFTSRRYNNAFITSIPALDASAAAAKLSTKLDSLNLPSALKSVLNAWRLPEGTDFHIQSARHNTALYAQFLKLTGHKTYFLNEERIATGLMIHLLHAPNSPLYRLISDKELLLRLMHTLSGQDNTWTQEAVFTGSLKACLNFIHTEDLRRFGTALFYFIDAKGMKHNLLLHNDGKTLTLRSRQSAFVMEPAAILEALTEGSLLPNLFLVYFTLGLCANASLVGGPFFSLYSKPMLRLPAQLLGLNEPALIHETLLQSFILPIKVINGRLRAHALLHSDLLALPPLSTANIESLLNSKLEDCAALSIAEELLRLDLSAADIPRYEPALRAMLKAQAPLELQL